MRQQPALRIVAGQDQRLLYPAHFEFFPDHYLELTHQLRKLIVTADADTMAVATVGSLARVVDSDLVNDLAAPSRIKDTSWIKPGRVAWSWWSDHARPGSFDAQKRYVDFAQRMGWEYVLVDAGWDASWIPTRSANYGALSLGRW